MKKNLADVKGAAIAFLAVAAMIYILRGYGFAVSFLVFAVLFIAPLFLILKNFGISPAENIIFSACIGIGFFPLLVWYLNRLIYSLKLSAVIVWIVLAVAGVYLMVKNNEKD